MYLQIFHPKVRLNTKQCFCILIEQHRIEEIHTNLCADQRCMSTMPSVIFHSASYITHHTSYIINLPNCQFCKKILKSQKKSQKKSYQNLKRNLKISKKNL